MKCLVTVSQVGGSRGSVKIPQGKSLHGMG